MKNRILGELVNEKIFDIGRAADLLWIHIGEKILVKNYKGLDVEKGSYAIHVQCPWRIIHHGKLVLGNMDIYRHKDSIVESEFDWSEIGNSVFDEKIEKIKNEVLPIKVNDYILDAIGSLKLICEDEIIFEVTPNSSGKIEFWRYINNISKEHVVIFE